MSCKIPHHFLHVGRHVSCDTWLPCRHAQQNSPSTPLPHLTSEKVHPARGFQRPIREKVRPASPKTPKLGCFQPAGRTFSRSHPPSGRAGRTFSRTGHSHVATLKPITPPQPLIRASVKPPSPLRTPEQQPLKPVTPLQPKNTPQTPISHPQRRRRFQARLALRVQRRQQFQSHTSTTAQRRQQFQAKDLRHPHVATSPLLRKLARNSIGSTHQQHPKTLKYQRTQFKS